MNESIDAAASSTDTSVRPSVVLGVVALDTDQPQRLAEFYAALLDWRVQPSDEADWVQIGPATDAGEKAGGVQAGGGAQLAFQLVPDFRPPTWPTQAVPQQLHLDLDVADLDEGERFALSIGARRVRTADGDASFRVFLDPSGHPFCLCQAS